MSLQIFLAWCFDCSTRNVLYFAWEERQGYQYDKASLKEKVEQPFSKDKGNVITRINLFPVVDAPYCKAKTNNKYWKH